MADPRAEDSPKSSRAPGRGPPERGAAASPDAKASRAAPLGEDGEGAAALDRVLRETDYRARLSAEARDLFRLDLLLRAGVKGEISRRFCHRLAEEAERVEYGLLEVGARGNRTYAFFTEVTTAARWCARAIHALLHLRGRLVRYLGERADLLPFRNDLDELKRWLVDRLAALLATARDEAEERLGLSLPTDPFDADLLRGEEARWRLPQDADAAETVDVRERIAHLATSFLALGDEYQRLTPPASDDAAALEEFVRGSFPPSYAHAARVRMHAIQSTYDTVVATTSLEASDPTLKTFRGYVSILLHLMEATAYVLQMHARIEEDVRSATVRDRVASLVPPATLLRWVVRFGCASCAACFLEGRATGTRLLESYSRTKEVVLALPPGKKLHLRPAGLIVKTVLHHGMAVTMRMGDQDVDARQLMDVILLAASHPTSTHVGFRGDARALEDLTVLFANRLGEDGLERLPPSLAYLREGPGRPASGS